MVRENMISVRRGLINYFFENNGKSRFSASKVSQREQEQNMKRQNETDTRKQEGKPFPKQDTKILYFGYIWGHCYLFLMCCASRFRLFSYAVTFVYSLPLLGSLGVHAQPL